MPTLQHVKATLRVMASILEFLFFASRQLSSASSSSVLTRVFYIQYTGAIEVITSNREKSRNLARARRNLLDHPCDLVIHLSEAGVIFDFP